jgi:2-polyprenyl-3-methyl-5-hydroxy-6-metoxy-1,4-benzoquinol methylase
MSYRRYPLAGPPESSVTGWDAWAVEYATLGAANAVYALGKELLHALIDEVTPPPRDREAWVLDFHCGAGDDLMRFLARNWRAVGCDGSPGMLQAAAARCQADVVSGRLALWHGRAEDLAPGSFEGRRFDLIFSTTGGFAYLDDTAFVRAHRMLAELLQPGGVMVLAHLTPFCPAESLYHLAHLRLRRAVQRWRGRVDVTVRGERMVMRLRSAGHVRRLLSGVVQVQSMRPLLWCTPPFQSGFMPGRRALAVLRAIEYRTRHVGLLGLLADQVVCVARALTSSSNNAR